MFSSDICETFLNLFFIGLKNPCLHIEYPVELKTLLLVNYSNID